MTLGENDNVKILGLFEMHHGEQTVGKDAMNRSGEVAFGKARGISNLGIYCQSQKKLALGDRVVVFTFCFSNIWKTQEHMARP